MIIEVLANELFLNNFYLFISHNQQLLKQLWDKYTDIMTYRNNWPRGLILWKGRKWLMKSQCHSVFYLNTSVRWQYSQPAPLIMTLGVPHHDSLATPQRRVSGSLFLAQDFSSAHAGGFVFFLFIVPWTIVVDKYLVSSMYC